MSPQSVVRFCLSQTGLKASSRKDPRLGMPPKEANVVIMVASGTTTVIAQEPLQGMGRSIQTLLLHRNENLVPLKDTPVVGPQSQALTFWEFSSGNRLGSHGLGLHWEDQTPRK